MQTLASANAMHHSLAAAIMMMATIMIMRMNVFFFSSRRRHTRLQGDWSSDVCSSDLTQGTHDSGAAALGCHPGRGCKPRPGTHETPLMRVCQIGRASCRERV